MNSVDFCFWLQGFFEISDNKSVTDKQVEIIKNHLNLVFKHEIDPIREQETSTPKQVLDETHSPKLLVPKSQPGPFYGNGGRNDELVRC